MNTFWRYMASAGTLYFDATALVVILNGGSPLTGHQCLSLGASGLKKIPVKLTNETQSYM